MAQVITNCQKSFSLGRTVISGQCFRWSEEDGIYRGIVSGMELTASQDGDVLTVSGTDDESFVRRYFDLDRDYDAISRQVLSSEPKLCECESYAKGTHILSQEPFEALISFIISQNNNIPRIRSIISRLCARFGRDMGGYHAFPDAEALSRAEEADFAAIGCGYRSAYLCDAAKRVHDGRLDLGALSNAPTDDVRKALLEVLGVGPKVAECVLLYGFGRLEAFPVDVWIKRALKEVFGTDTPLLSSPYAGIAQQYIFEYIRTHYERHDK